MFWLIRDTLRPQRQLALWDIEPPNLAPLSSLYLLLRKEVLKRGLLLTSNRSTSTKYPGLFYKPRKVDMTVQIVHPSRFFPSWKFSCSITFCVRPAQYLHVGNPSDPGLACCSCMMASNLFHTSSEPVRVQRKAPRKAVFLLVGSGYSVVVMRCGECLPAGFGCHEQCLSWPDKAP